ncbi:MAG: TRAP transporter substrate-binding protein DctP [Thermoanaerobaculia bacterium]|nr:TRAP transporter substrate-binding protein DctP [Thermoanaerobaculia bacterium]
MNRRNFLKTAASGLAGAGLTASCAAPQGQGAPAVQTQPNVSWRLVSSFPRGLDTIYGTSEVLAERLAALSEGRFQIRVYPAGELVPALQVLDAVQQGTAQVGQTASYYYTGKNPALAFDACVPFGLTSRQQTAWLTEGGGLDLMNELFADFNVLTFPAGNTGAQMGGWFKREIGSAADLVGLKMRIPGLGGEVMSRLGTTVQVLAGGDIYPALERGAIDATEWVGPYDDEKLGFHQIAKFYYYPGWWEPGPSLSYYVNRDAWAKLPVVYQEMFKTAALDSAVTMQARYDARNPAALARLLDAGVEVKPFSDDLLTAARRVALDMLEEQAASDATYRKVYTAWSKFRAETYRWFGTAELAFARFAFAAG